MASIIGATAVGVVLVILVIGLSMLTISRGYAYKHKIDPAPDEITNKEKTER